MLSSTQGFLLALHSEITPSRDWGNVYGQEQDGSSTVSPVFLGSPISFPSFISLPSFFPFFPLSLLPMPSQLGIKSRSSVCKASAPSAILQLQSQQVTLFYKFLFRNSVKRRPVLWAGWELFDCSNDPAQQRNFSDPECAWESLRFLFAFRYFQVLHTGETQMLLTCS